MGYKVALRVRPDPPLSPAGPAGLRASGPAGLPLQ
jgi:hypothetical protein